MPEGVRWWTENAARFAETRKGSERWKRTMRHYLGGLAVNFPRAGVDCPSTPANLTRNHVLALREADLWAPTTTRAVFLVLRWFAAWARNPVAEDEELWALPTGSPVRRRWLTEGQLAAVWNAAQGRERLVIALEGFNGLRRCEVLRLRVRDLDLAADAPQMTVLGKGLNGGKWRTIPITPFAYSELLSASVGLGPNARLYTLHERTADHDVRAACVRAGLGPNWSGHDFRRTFGRLAYESGVGLVELQYLYGHASPAMTAHYIGLDQLNARAQLARWTDRMKAVAAHPQVVPA